jgi:hypothetical protein
MRIKNMKIQSFLENNIVKLSEPIVLIFAFVRMIKNINTKNE